MHVKYGFIEEIHDEENYQKLINQILQTDIKLIMFFVPGNYKFEVLAKLLSNRFVDSVILGSNAGGQILPGFGYTENKIVAFSISSDDFEVEPCIMKDIKNKAMFSAKMIKETAEKLNINDKNKGFGLLIVDGLCQAEEKVLMAINSAIPEIPIVGGSASDNWEFKETHISCNGEIFTGGAVLALIRTGKPFFCYRENIYGESSDEFKITEIENPRCIAKIDGKPAAEVYAQTLNCKIEELSKKFMQRPVGRVFGKEIWIATPTEVTESGGVVVFANVAPNTKIEILNSLKPVEVAKNTAKIIGENIKKPKVVIGFNCMMRHLQFKNEDNALSVYEEINKVAPFVGFSTYGEQMNNFHCNQTLTLLVLGE